jgi:hypothetical protein
VPKRLSSPPTRKLSERYRTRLNRAPRGPGGTVPRSDTPTLTPSSSAPPVASVDPVDSAITKARRDGLGRQSLAHLWWLDSSPEFRAIVLEYLSGNPPPVFFTTPCPPPSFADEAQHYVVTLAYNLCEVSDRIAAWKEKGLTLDWERELKKAQEEWKGKRAELAQKLIDAANLIESGRSVSTDWPYPTSLEDAKRQSEGEFRNVDKVPWCGADNLRRWAATVKIVSVEVVFPDARLPSRIPFRPESAGTRGAARNRKGPHGGISGLRGWAVKEIERFVPTVMPDKYVRIAKLACSLGLDGTTRQHVRSILEHPSRKKSK